MMYTRTLFMVTLCALMMACSSQKKATTSPAPPIMENELTEITVREEKVQPVDLPDETVYKYYVVIGSFKVIENARKFRVDLVKEDFLPVILENENGLFRVSVASTDKENEAREKISWIRSKYPKYNDVWLLVRK